MPSLICSHCSRLVETAEAPPAHCPFCGETLLNADEPTQDREWTACESLQPQELPGSTIGRYRIERELGSGGFGSVFLAHDPQLDRDVAIKVPRADFRLSQAALDRFAREARSAAQLHHPGIVSIFNVERDEDRPLIVSEYVEGNPLNERLKDAQFTFVEIAQLISSLATAVDYAHSEGIVHRDIKPSNIMIATDGTPRLMDFGLAKRESDEDSLVTVGHHVHGTPVYMSPEQARGNQKEIDKRTDVYSLGAVLYQLLTRETPFRGEPSMVIQQVLEEEPRNPRALDTAIPPDLETICLKAMEKSREKRYQSAFDLAADLDRWLRHEPIHARPVGRFERAYRWCSRNPLPAGLAAVIALVLTTSACGGFLLAGAKQRALTQTEKLLRENQSLLSGAFVERASRYLAPETATEVYSPIKALPWLYAAVQLDDKNPDRRDASRIRLGTTLRGSPSVQKIWSHGGTIISAAASPSGDRFFTGGADGTGRLWDPSEDEPLTPDLAHPARICAARFSSDGKLLLTGCADGAIRLWDVGTRKQLGKPLRIGQPTNRPYGDFNSTAIAFAKNGKRFTAADGSTFQIWDIATRRLIGPVHSCSAQISTLCLAGSGERAVARCVDDSIVVWNVETSEEKHLQTKTRVTGDASRSAAALAPDNVTVAGGSGPRSVRMWNCETGKEAQFSPLIHDTRVGTIRFSPDGRFLATGTVDGTVYLWAMEEGRLVWKQRRFTSYVSQLAFESSGRSLAAISSSAGLVCIFDVEDGVLSAEPVGLPHRTESIFWMGENRSLVVPTEDGVIRQWNPELEDSADFITPSGQVKCACVADNCEFIATADSNGSCCIEHFDATSVSKTTRTTFATGVRPHLITIAPDITKVAIAESKSNVRVFDLAARAEKLQLETGSRVARLAFSADSTSLTAVGENGTIDRWNASTGERLYHRKIDVKVRTGFVDIDLEARKCAIASMNQVRVFDSAADPSAEPLLIKVDGPVYCRLNSSRRILLTGGTGGIAQIWDCATGKLLAFTPKLSTSIGCLEFSPDGSEFVTGCDDGALRLWHTADATPSTGSFFQGSAVLSCTFSPDGRWLATTSEPDTGNLLGGNYAGNTLVRGWDIATAEPIFVRTLSQFGTRLPDAPHAHLWRVILTFFPCDGREVRLLTSGGLLARIDLAADIRPTEAIVHEVAIRTGTEPDQAGGLLLINPARLLSIKRSGSFAHGATSRD